MKILMLSIFAPHFFNWAEQLKDSGHEVYWLDIFDSNTEMGQIDFVEQIIGWRYRWDYPGRYFLKKNAPAFTRLINIFNERDLQKMFDKKLREIKPDVVHSFVMYLASSPIREVMKQHPNIKWVYSSWGSDLYFYRNRERELREMKQTLPELDYMFSDCHRDYEIALVNGFSGEFLGVFPGRGGYDFRLTDSLMMSFGERKNILVKGYQGLHGRCIPVLKALWNIKEEIETKGYKVIVFGTDKEVREYVANSPLKNWEKLQVFGNLPHLKVMRLMGASFLYVGNSHSDGTPNTLLEAIILGTFPVQSNPGGATEELIEHRKNGLLIEDPENFNAIAELLMEAIDNSELRRNAVAWNLERIKPELERGRIRQKVLNAYQKIEEEL